MIQYLSHVPERTRVLHVIVPEAILWHVRAMASESRLPMKQYVAMILKDARPIELMELAGQNQQSHHEDTVSGDIAGSVPTRRIPSPLAQGGQT
jgi:hypothetical protein